LYNIYSRGVSEALYHGIQVIQNTGVEVNTRNGKALEFPMPVCTEYTHSWERVLFYPQRDANPYFHFMESLWMLAGRNDVEWISQFNGRINNYSDDGITFHGAYGYRWRKHFGVDQLNIAKNRLVEYPNDRRVVIGMWDPYVDLTSTNTGVDYPCNTQVFFWARKGYLNMSVVNRSNDMIWGAYGANAVHMSFLLEYMALMTGNKIGMYYQISNNLHVYTDVLEKLNLYSLQPDYEPYLLLAEDGLSYNSPPLIDNAPNFDSELYKWFDDYTIEGLTNTYLTNTATPMMKSWEAWKKKELLTALKFASRINDRAWRRACIEWLERRLK
jgi:thymidylate synthase